MATSRGLLSAPKHLQFGARRQISSLVDNVLDTAKRVQSYVSTSTDPYLNLSIEHYLLQKSSPDSTILFIYANRPCVVIGRNQNPWYEVNLGILKTLDGNRGKETEPPGIGNVDLVRRRSGGGTVFHDEGNVNWSVICPPAGFTRDKHAEMVVRALRKKGIVRARVNERHDIVLDQGPEGSSIAASEDTHATRFMAASGEALRPLKVSGSAYKLTRTRALHHGTCLLQSPNLHIIPQYLQSPVRPYIKARGVESVSSPVANIGLDTRDFKNAVRREFAETYKIDNVEPCLVGQGQLENPDVRQGYEELRSLDWIFSQTPQFTLSSRPLGNDASVSDVAPSLSCEAGAVVVTVKNGVIIHIETGSQASTAVKEEALAMSRLKLTDLDGQPKTDRLRQGTLGSWLSSALPTRP